MSTPPKSVTVSKVRIRSRIWSSSCDMIHAAEDDVFFFGMVLQSQDFMGIITFNRDGLQLALESGPVTRRRVGIEEPDAAASDDQRGRGELAVVLEVQQIVADLLLGEPVRWGVEVVGQLPDGAEIGLLSTLAQTGELEVLEHPLTEWRGHVWSCARGDIP